MIMSNMPTQNYGELLYLKGKALAITLEKKRQTEAQLKSEKEMEGATFKPVINCNSARVRSFKTEDLLLAQGELANARKERLKQQLEIRKMEDVTFKPSILKKSEQMVANRKKDACENIIDTPQRAVASAK